MQSFASIGSELSLNMLPNNYNVLDEIVLVLLLFDPSEKKMFDYVMSILYKLLRIMYATSC